MQNQSINSPDCVNLSIHGLDYRPHMKGFIFDVMKEIWKDVKGYEGCYQINKFGLIKSLERTINCRNNKSYVIKGRMLKPASSKKEYLRTILQKNGQQKTYRIHRLTAHSFVPNPENKPQINHKNGIKFDNFYKNLEWVTPSENAIHAFKTGLKTSPMLGKFGKDHNRSKPVLQYDLQGNFIAEYGGQYEAMRVTGISRGVISGVCHGRYKTAGGYIWRFKPGNKHQNRNDKTKDQLIESHNEFIRNHGIK